MLVCFVLFRTRGCGASSARHSLRPLLSRVILAKLGRIAPRDREGVFGVDVIARSGATKQSTLTSRQHGLLRRGVYHRARRRRDPFAPPNDGLRIGCLKSEIDIWISGLRCARPRMKTVSFGLRAPELRPFTARMQR